MWAPIILSCVFYTMVTVAQPRYLIVIPAELTFPSVQRVCLDLRGVEKPIRVALTLVHSSSSLVLFRRVIRNNRILECSKFLVPSPAGGQEEVCTVQLTISNGRYINVKEKKKVLIRRGDSSTFVQTDKSVYTPGQKVKFRILTLNEEFVPLNSKDPNSNRIGQWLDVRPRQGIVDLSFQLADEPSLGTYTISVAGTKASSTFSVEEYVLPKFEVFFEGPVQIYALDKTFPLRVCGRYTYGRAVQGTTRVTLCQKAWRYTRPPRHFGTDICEEYSGQTTSKGCFSTSVRMAVFNFTSYEYDSKISAEASLVEDSTGVQINASSQFLISRTAVTATFEELDGYYIPGVPYRGKIKLQDHRGDIMKSTKVYLVISYMGRRFNKTYITDGTGRASFNMDTTAWNSSSVSLEGRFNLEDLVQEPGKINVDYVNTYQYLQPFHVTTKSFLKIHPLPGTLPCGLQQNVQVTFALSRKDLGEGASRMDFAYYVTGKAGIVVWGQKNIRIGKLSTLKGSFSIPLTFTSDVTPTPSLVVYAIFPSKGVAADSIQFDVAMCFRNQVTMGFSAKETLPGSTVQLQLQAASGSVCAVRAVDKSVLLMRPEKELTNQTSVGLKIFSNLMIKKPTQCYYPMDKRPTAPPLRPISILEAPPESTIPGRVRQYFPETWLWDLISVGPTGNRDVPVTVPDTITEWKAGMFCMARLGFGLAPTTSLVTFQPFFVDVTLPYSVVREETFTLKATVFNYLQQCIQPEGVLVEKAHSCLLCPRGGNTVKDPVSLTLPANVVKGSARATISVLGDIMGTALQNLDRLVQMPSGCGEQNMVRFAPIIYVLQYLEKTGQLTPEIRERATGFLRSGYQRQLLYKHSHGAYSAFGQRDREGNTWLTAFVVKSFGQAKKSIFIDDKNIQDALKWLELHQLPSGCFTNKGRLFHSSMKGGVNDEISLGAYITAALLELGQPLKGSMVQAALRCLIGVVHDVTNIYTEAVLAYAFALAGDYEVTQELLYKLDEQAIRSGGQIHWSPKPSSPAATDFWPRTQSMDVELTAYVLLAYLSKPRINARDMATAAGIVAWLAQQQNAHGGFASTQDTVVALQALAKYAARTFSTLAQVTVTVKSQGRFERKFQVTHKNRLLLQQAVLTEIPGEFSLQAQGSGCVYAQTVLRYNEPPPWVSVTFSLRVTTQLIDCTKGNARFLTVRIHISYIGSRVTSNMVIVEVSLLSGFSLASGSRTSLSDESQIFVLQLEQEIEVKGLKPANIKVYDYYQPEERALADYNAACS
ncbi:alpha-2-macroglobulin-like protein 1 [Pangshura tecta]